LRIVLLNEASDEKFTVGGNNFRTLMICSAKKIRKRFNIIEILLQ